MKKFLMFALAVFGAGGAFAKVDVQKATSESMGNFGFQLLRSLAEAEGDEPLAVSPMSLAEALSMAAQGSEKETLQELESLFVSAAQKKSGFGMSGFSAGISDLRAKLLDYSKKSKGTFDYSSANALWGNTNPSIGFEFKPAFVKAMSEKYGATLNLENFAKGKAADNINAWVAENTKEKIKKLVSKLNDEDVAVLLNAIYAKGKFVDHFSQLEEAEYTNARGQKLPVTQMKLSEQLGFAKSANAALYSLPVGESAYGGIRDQVALDVIVPRKGSIEDLLGSLTGKAYSDLVADITLSPIELNMPAAKVEQKEALKLKDIFQSVAFNVTRPFDPSLAQFSLLGSTRGEHNLHVSEVLTKTFYEVTPLGFEAAAATAVIMSRADTSVLEYVKHEIKGPSLHVVRHVPTGAPLFIVLNDSPVKYDENRIVLMVEEARKAQRSLSAKMQGGTIRYTYDPASSKPVIALTDENGKILKIYKTL
jgi:serine protease inhibitor